MNDVNVKEKIDGVFEIISYGSQMLLIGMATIFAVLIAIFLFIKLLQFILSGSSTEKTAKTKAPVTADTPIIAENHQNDEIVAVIAAAIAMAESESGGLKFRVVSFRKK